MAPSPSPDFRSALAALSEALKSIGRPAMLIGGLAVMDFPRTRRTVAGFYELLEVPERLKEFDQLVSQALDEA